MKAQRNNTMPDFDVMARLHELMDSRGWSTYELSQRAGLAGSTLQTMVLRGNQPSLGTIKAICGAMGITLEQFVCDRNGQYQNDEQELMHNYGLLTAEQQRLVRELVANLVTPQ